MVKQNKNQYQDRLPNSIFEGSDRILTTEPGDQFNNARNKGDEISNDASKNVHRNLDEMDRRIENAKNMSQTGYGVYNADNTEKEYDIASSREILDAINKSQYDRVIPILTEMKRIDNSPLFECPLGRFSPLTNKVYNDGVRKQLYVEQSNQQLLQIGKDMPQKQPVITHEFLAEKLELIGEEFGGEFEIAPDKVYDERRGYRRSFTVFSPRMDREVEDSFRIGDVIRIGGLVRNGIDEGMGVGVDAFTYCVLCANGSVGRGEDIGSVSYAHKGLEENLQEKIVNGLRSIFEISYELATYQIDSNKIKLRHKHIQEIYDKLTLADKYYDDKYFLLNKDAKNLEDRIKLQKDLDGNITLWEGYNALTAPIWHSNLAFGGKSIALRQLNNQLVQIVKRDGVHLQSVRS